jgi:hypothetical protein
MDEPFVAAISTMVTRESNPHFAQPKGAETAPGQPQAVTWPLQSKKTR